MNNQQFLLGYKEGMRRAYELCRIRVVGENESNSISSVTDCKDVGRYKIERLRKESRNQLKDQQRVTLENLEKAI